MDELIKTWPEKIFLQAGDDFDDGLPAYDDVIHEYDGVTWCAESVVSHEVQYVRDDLVDELKAENESLREQLRLVSANATQLAEGVLKLQVQLRTARAEERLHCADLADQWGNARVPDGGGNALRNYAIHLRALGDAEPQKGEGEWYERAAAGFLNHTTTYTKEQAMQEVKQLKPENCTGSPEEAGASLARSIRWP